MNFSAMAVKGNRFALSISSWFCVPEQGMKEFEMLCRASAFLVPSRFGGEGPGATHRFPSGMAKPIPKGYEGAGKLMHNTFLPRFHVLTASHVVSPWRWPKYYPDDWLRFVNEKHCHYTLELRDENGLFMTQSECFPVTYHHRHRDMAVLHLEDEIEAIKTFKNMDVQFPELLLPPIHKSKRSNTQHSETLYHFLRQTGDYSLSSTASNGSNESHTNTTGGTRLEFVGHEVSEGSADGMELAGGQKNCIPRTTWGDIHARTQAQLFCKTAKTLTEGMCGGPVLAHVTSPMSTPVCISSNLDVAANESSATAKAEADDPVNIPMRKIKPKRSAVSVLSLNDKTGKAAVAGIYVAGMTEGIVPLTYHDKSMRGLAVFVEAPLIDEFLQDIEQGPIVSGVDALIGGHSVEHIATTQHQPEFVMPHID